MGDFQAVIAFKLHKTQLLISVAESGCLTGGLVTHSCGKLLSAHPTSQQPPQIPTCEASSTCSGKPSSKSSTEICTLLVELTLSFHYQEDFPRAKYLIPSSKIRAKTLGLRRNNLMKNEIFSHLTLQ